MRVVVWGAQSAAVGGVVGVESKSYEFASCAWVVVGDDRASGASFDDTDWIAA